MTLLELPIIIGLWAYLFTHHLVQPGEVLAFIGGGVNKVLTGNANVFANPDDQNGVKLLLWKYVYCEKCHAGILGVVMGAMASRPGMLFTDVFCVGVLAMLTSLLAKRIIQGV